jgi:hypothetical protein
MRIATRLPQDDSDATTATRTRARIVDGATSCTGSWSSSGEADAKRGLGVALPHSACTFSRSLACPSAQRVRISGGLTGPSAQRLHILSQPWRVRPHSACTFSRSLGVSVRTALAHSLAALARRPRSPCAFSRSPRFACPHSACAQLAHGGPRARIGQPRYSRFESSIPAKFLSNFLDWFSPTSVRRSLD